MRIGPEPFDAPDAAALREELRLDLLARYGRPDTEPGVKPTADDIAVFLVARGEDGAPLGCGALRLLDTAGEAELKRMFVRPAARGSGVAVALLRALEDEARARGVTRLLLETGTAQPEAIRFYLREGYAEIPLFGGYVGSTLSRCFARALPPR